MHRGKLIVPKLRGSGQGHTCVLPSQHTIIYRRRKSYGGGFRKNCFFLNFPKFNHLRLTLRIPMLGRESGACVAVRVICCTTIPFSIQQPCTTWREKVYYRPWSHQFSWSSTDSNRLASQVSLPHLVEKTTSQHYRPINQEEGWHICHKQLSGSLLPMVR